MNFIIQILLAQRNKLILVWILIVAILLLLGCGNSSSPGNSQVGSAVFRLGIKEPAVPAGSERIQSASASAGTPIDCAAHGIATINCKILNSDSAIVIEETFPCSQHEGRIKNIPAGDNRDIVIDAINEDKILVYRGQKLEVKIPAWETTNLGTIELIPLENVENIIIDAGEDQKAVIKQVVQLDAAGSKSVFDTPLSYNWSISSAPSGSTVTLSDATNVSPRFIPDVKGRYTIELIVEDELANSNRDSVIVVAEDPNIDNSLNVFSCSFLEESTVELTEGQSYWIRMSIGCEGDNGYDTAVNNYENISLTVTLNGQELQLHKDTKIEYNSGAGFWEINGYYNTGVLERGNYKIIGTSYDSGNYVDSATFFIITE